MPKKGKSLWKTNAKRQSVLCINNHFHVQNGKMTQIRYSYAYILGKCWVLKHFSGVLSGQYIEPTADTGT